MCGFTGFLTVKNEMSEPAIKGLLDDMASTIIHRGPDSAGQWMDLEAGISFAHRRLAIVDISPSGAQPMISASGRYVIAFNGEIYNHNELRSQLLLMKSTIEWRGHSDTETLLSCFDFWGVEKTLRATNGMFAFSLWDRKYRILTLGRDRLGEKPLYYGWQGHGSSAAFIFGSELSSLRRHPGFSAQIDRNALSSYMRHTCVGGVNSIYEGIYKLLPGNILRVSTTDQQPITKAWWSVSDAIQTGEAKPFLGTAEDAVVTLEEVLRGAVERQMMSDVPLGAFLSGGVDSSAIVALMQSQSRKKIKTFTIGFNEQEYNEAPYAQAVANQLGTDHTELYVSAKQALDIIPKLPTIFSEPFADSSQIPTFLVSQLAQAQVKVCLSGDGGDELFCGYNRYKMTSELWTKLNWIPRGLRRTGAALITSLPPAAWDRVGHLLSIARYGDKLHKGSRILDKATIQDLYQSMLSQWDEPDNVVLGGQEQPNSLTFDQPAFYGLKDLEIMMALDMCNYLPDVILTKVDRAAMGVGLETRAPFLDHRVVEFACSLPLDFKLRNGVTKWPLRQVLYRYVKPEFIERPKMGFGVPIDQWLRGPLRDWAEDLLGETRLRNEGFLNPVPIRKKWEEHLSGRRNWQSQLWTILMFQAWREGSV